jgi:CDP-glycerol glycerophosphotransferase (TagB/SpsB family)
MELIDFDWTKKLSDDDLNQFESKHNIKLPLDYRQFILQHNGCYIRNSKNLSFSNQRLYSYLKDNTQSVKLIYFYSLDANSPEGKQRIYTIPENKRYKNGRLLEETLPIAKDEGDNEIVINLKKGPEYGNIYFWDHEFEEEKPTANNMTILTYSFTSLLESLA